jgi:hypothetical protein
MLLQNIPYKLSRKDQPSQVFRKLFQFLKANNMEPTQIFFRFTDHYVGNASACERAIKAFPALNPFLQENPPSGAVHGYKFLSNRTAKMTPFPETYCQLNL